jgi:CDP-diglyceride synthetase
MADNKRRGRFAKNSEDATQSIFDLFEPPPEQEASSFGRIPIIRDEGDEDSLDLTDVEYVEAQAAAEAEAAGLRHWTEPATGQVPAAFGADRGDRSGEVRGPSWRGDEPDWAGPDLADVFADTEAISHDRPERSRSAPNRGRFDDELSIDPEPDVTSRPPRAGTEWRQRERPVRPGPDDGGASIFDDATPLDAGRLGAPPPPPAARPAPPPPERVGGSRSPAGPGRLGRSPGNGSELAPPPPAPAPPPARGAPSALGAPSGEAPPPPERDRTRSTRRGAHDLEPDHDLGPSLSTDAAVEFDRMAADPGLDFDLGPRPDSRPASTPFTEPEPTGEIAARVIPEARPPAYAGPARAHEPLEPPTGVLSEGMEPDYDDAYDDDYPVFDETESGGRNLGQSTAVGIGLAAVVAISLGLGSLATLVLVSALCLLAVMELFNAMRLAGLRPATLLGLVGAVALPASTYVRGEAGYPLVIGLAVVFGMLWYLTGADSERPVLNLGLTLTGILWVGGLAGFAALMLRVEGGRSLLLATIIITAMSDTLAYLGGKAYGTKPFHSASPNKTWEGTLTGFFGALFAGLVLGVTDVISLFSQDFTAIMALAVVIGVLAPMGDLAESLVKRDLGIKDMGSLLPGHGGVLDRVDGLLFALPGAYYLAIVFQLI